MKLFDKLKAHRYCKKYADYEHNEYNYFDLKFIWGEVSCDNLNGSEANLYTLNDIDIVYNRKTKKYMLGIETVYYFEDKREEVEYLEMLLVQLHKFMIENCYDTNYEYSLWHSPHLITEADSIPELYTNFKLFVAGYKLLYGGDSDV